MCVIIAHHDNEICAVKLFAKCDKHVNHYKNASSLGYGVVNDKYEK